MRIRKQRLGQQTNGNRSHKVRGFGIAAAVPLQYHGHQTANAEHGYMLLHLLLICLQESLWNSGLRRSVGDGTLNENATKAAALQGIQKRLLPDPKEEELLKFPNERPIFPLRNI